MIRIRCALAALSLLLNAVSIADARFPRGTPAVFRPQISLSAYGATCNGSADDTAAFIAFKNANQGSAPIQLNLPGFCTYNPVGGSNDQYLFLGVRDLVVAGNGAATSGIKSLSATSGMLFGGKGQYQDSSHSLRTLTASAGDSCVTAKSQPAVTVSGAAPSIPFSSTFTASASGNTMTVTTVSSGTIVPGAIVDNLDSNTGYFNTVLPYGTNGTTGVGGAGTYAMSVSQSWSSQATYTVPVTFTASVDTAGVMTVTSIADGALAVGMFMFSTSAAVGQSPTQGPTTIKSQLTGATGGTGTYQLDHAAIGAVPSQVFQGGGQVRLTINSTAGLSSGDTLFISGMTGRGLLPQRINGLKWVKVVDGTHIDLFQWHYSGGYVSGGAGGGDRTSLFSTGSKAMMTGWVNQAYWATAYGFPSNHHWFEFKTVTTVNPGTQQICFDTPLAYSYKSTWPQFNTGSQFNVDAGGPATVYLLDPTWEATYEFKDFTLDDVNFQVVANARKVTWRNVKMMGIHCAIPSQNETHSWIGTDTATCNIETDKLVKTWNLTDLSLNLVTIQSSAMDTISLSNVTAKQWSGSPKRLVIDNGTFTCTGCGTGAAGLAPGTAAYGASDETVVTNSSVGNLLSYTSPIQRVDDPTHPWSMTSGVITIPNAYSWSGCCNQSETQTRGMVPGHYVAWLGSSGSSPSVTAQVGRIFKVVDVTQDLDNIYVQTSEAGGFPTSGTWAQNGLSVFPHPAPLFTASGLSGADTALAFNGCTSLPMFSCQNFTYTGSATGGSTTQYAPTLWGELSSFTYTNNVPYAGGGALSWTQSRFGNWQVLKTDFTVASYGTSPDGQNSINTKLPTTCSPLSTCTRTQTPSGSTNTQTLDVLTAPPANAWFGLPPSSGPIFSSNTPSDSPQVSATWRTNQQLPFLLKRDMQDWRYHNDNDPMWMGKAA